MKGFHAVGGGVSPWAVGALHQETPVDVTLHSNSMQGKNHMAVSMDVEKCVDEKQDPLR